MINELKEQLLKAGKVIEASDARRGELEKELTSTKEKLEEASKYAEEADKKIATLEAELSGTKEQLEAAMDHLSYKISRYEEAMKTGTLSWDDDRKYPITEIPGVTES